MRNYKPKGPKEPANLCVSFEEDGILGIRMHEDHQNYTLERGSCKGGKAGELDQPRIDGHIFKVALVSVLDLL